MQQLASVAAAANRRRSFMAGPILPAFSKLSQVLHQRQADPTMDTLVFKLHYRLTTRILLLFAFVASTHALVGELIECTTDSGVPRPVINSYCLVTATFSVETPSSATPHHGPTRQASYSKTSPTKGRIRKMSPHAANSEIPRGLGPPVSARGSGENATKVKRRHVFYQWVPIVLAVQAMLFYIPHALWKNKSGGVMRNCFAFQLDMPDTTLHNSSTKLISFAGYLSARMGRVNQHLVKMFFLTELLCLINVIGNIFLLNAYVSDDLPAYSLAEIASIFGSTRENPHETMFPDTAKCTFRKFGISGTLEKIDALCVLPHNVFYRKMFTFLWLWMAFLCGLSLLHAAYRVTSLLVPKVRRNVLFSLLLEDFLEYGRLVFEQCTVYDWFLLCNIGRRMDSLAFSELVRHLATGGNSLLLATTPTAGSRRASQWSERRPTDRHTSVIMECTNKLTPV